MSPRKRRADPLETAIADALEPGRFFSWRAVSGFVEDLEALDEEIWKLALRGEAERAARLYETFIAGCHEKADEVHDSGGWWRTSKMVCVDDAGRLAIDRTAPDLLATRRAVRKLERTAILPQRREEGWRRAETERKAWRAEEDGGRRP